jgi:hypothetical protein
MILNKTAAASTIVANADSNVGIGTASPATKLHVLGSARIEGNDFRVDNNADANTTVTIDSGGSLPQASRFVFADRGDDKWRIIKDSIDELSITKVGDSPLMTFKVGNVTDLDTEFTKANTDGMDIHAHAARHEPGGADPISGLGGGGGSPSELQGLLIYGNPFTVALIPTVGGSIVVNIDGTQLTRTSPLVFVLGDSGAPGSHLDTGLETSSTPYYLYIDNVAGVMIPVISATPPDNLGDTKPGYHPVRTDERCIGSIWNNSTEDITPFNMVVNKVMFRNHDWNHEYNLSENASTSWYHLSVNLPESASSVFISSSARWPTATGMVCWGVDGATGVLTAHETDPTAAGFENVILYAMSSGTNDGNGISIQGELQIIDGSSPAISYGITRDLHSDHFMIVGGYTDRWAPRQ